MIRKELAILKDVNHAHTVAYYGSYFHKKELWIVMEYCEGGSIQVRFRCLPACAAICFSFLCLILYISFSLPSPDSHSHPHPSPSLFRAEPV